MTEVQAKRKIRELSKDASEFIQKEALRLFNSGAVDTRIYDDDYLLPKMLIHVALLNCADQYRLVSRSKDKEIRNLKHF